LLARGFDGRVWNVRVGFFKFAAEGEELVG
jgi:hypothetical protein